MDQKSNPVEKVNSWIRNSVTLKLFTITILMLLLLIPASMVETIISEREQLNDQTTNEVSSGWAGNQLVNGPVLTIPLVYEHRKGEEFIETTRYYYLLPDELNIKGRVEPKSLKRGIYEVVVFESDLFISGTFSMLEKIDSANLKEIRLDQAFLTVGISDLKGIKDQVVMKWNDRELHVKPGSRISQLIPSGVTFELPQTSDLLEKPVQFGFSLDLQGSGNISFIPLGRNTNVELTSGWSSPSFNGKFLPDTREVGTEGFLARWKVLQLNRNFPQQWVESDQFPVLQNAAFGVDLILPLDDYQKSMRSAKYAAMTIALTFLIFFLAEVLTKRKIHPFQYTLVGLALCLFYILLVSVSEHLDFNVAYGISSFGIITMIGLYSLSVFKVRKFTIILIATLASVYGFLFVILQLSDYALLMGSGGLVLIIGLTMYFTRNINWYKLNMGDD